MKRVGGMRRNTRSKFRKDIKEKGFLPITKFLQKFEDGDKVVLKAFTSYQKGMYHPRFHGRIGSIAGTQGNCYFIDIKDGSKLKKMLVHPVHLKKIQNGKL